jgi:hypothetical protein
LETVFQFERLFLVDCGGMIMEEVAVSISVSYPDIRLGNWGELGDTTVIISGIWIEIRTVYL